MDGARAVALPFLEGMDAVEPHAPGAVAIGAEIGQRSHVAAGVPFLARRRASMAPDANVEVDHKPELFLAGLRFGQRSHCAASSRSVPAK